jgi:predicted phage-related endonuclease
LITHEQRERRKSGLFASDVARIMTGHSVAVALEKLGLQEPANLDDDEGVQLGNLFEPRVLDSYEAATGSKIIRAPDTMRHPKMPWLGCHLDGYAPPAVVESKAYSIFNRGEWGTAGSDEVPANILWQTQAQMLVAGADHADVPVCFINDASSSQAAPFRSTSSPSPAARS